MKVLYCTVPVLRTGVLRRGKLHPTGTGTGTRHPPLSPTQHYYLGTNTSSSNDIPTLQSTL